MAAQACTHSLSKKSRPLATFRRLRGITERWVDSFRNFVRREPLDKPSGLFRFDPARGKHAGLFVHCPIGCSGSRENSKTCVLLLCSTPSCRFHTERFSLSRLKTRRKSREFGEEQKPYTRIGILTSHPTFTRVFSCCEFLNKRVRSQAPSVSQVRVL